VDAYLWTGNAAPGQHMESLPKPFMSQKAWLMSSLAATAFGLIIIFSLGNRLTKPIIRLSHAATAMAAGDFRRRIKINTGDEMETLGKAFSSLGDSLTDHEITVKQHTIMLAGMVEAARDASSSLDVKKCGKAIANAVCTHLNASDTAVFIKNNVDGGLKLLASHGQRHKTVWKRLASHVIDSGSYLVLTEHDADHVSHRDAILVGVPLSTGTETIGAITAKFGNEIARNDLKPAGIRSDLLITFGIHAAAAISNAIVHSDTEKYSEVLEDWIEHLSAVMEVTNAISPSLNLDETLTALAKAASSAMAADECAIYLVDRNGNLPTKSCCHPEDMKISTLKIRPGELVTGKAFAERRHVFCCDCTSSTDPKLREVSAYTGYKSIMSAPLVVENHALGAISVYNRETHKFTPKEIRLLTSIALHTAVIVRNAGLYTHQSSIAEQLQSTLISEVPYSCMGLSIASRYIPALDEARVGGDFYDVFVLPNDKVGVIIADVSGKGLMAAIHLAACKHMLKAMMFEHVDDPAQALHELNEAINHFFDLSFFVTVFCGVIDPDKEIMVYANAGHPPGLMMTDNWKVQHSLASTGMPAGSGQLCHYEMANIQFSASDTLLLYTDGVTDALVYGIPLEIDGIKRIMFEAGMCSPSELIDIICSHLQTKSGSTNKDDIAILAIAHSQCANEGSKTGGLRGQGYSISAHTG
jgi:sigma-B regulation protein RsbU (phosphoserine phosphatase)